MPGVCLVMIEMCGVELNERILVKTVMQGICYLCEELSDAWQ